MFEKLSKFSFIFSMILFAIMLVAALFGQYQVVFWLFGFMAIFCLICMLTSK